MKLKRLTPTQKIEIWQPRYHDKMLLIAKWKVGLHNLIVFTKDERLKGEFYLSATTINKYPIEKIRDKTGTEREFYAVPQDELERFEGRYEQD